MARKAATRFPVPAVVLLGLCGGLAACSASESDFQTWAGSKKGIARMEEYVSNPDHDQAMRLRALEIVVENQQDSAIRGLLEKCPDRAALAAAFKERLLGLLAKGDANTQVSAKNALLHTLPLLKEAERTAVRERVAAWAFAGLPSDASAELLDERFQQRGMNVDQVIDLGTDGIPWALLLLQRGLEIEKAYNFLIEFETPEVQTGILEAFQTLHKLPKIEIPAHHLTKIFALKSPEAALYLIELHGREDLPADVRSDALALAIQLFKLPEVRKAGDRLLPALDIVMARRNPDDRRLAAHYILRFGGVEQLPKMLNGFADDRTFQAKYFETAAAFVDICRDDVLKLRGDPFPALEAAAQGGSRVARVLAVVCLKASSREEIVPKLEGLLKDTTDIKDILGGSEAAVVTLGSLARNAIDAVKVVAQLKQERDAGRLSKDDYESKRRLLDDDFERNGPALLAALEERFKAAPATPAPSTDTPASEPSGE